MRHYTDALLDGAMATRLRESAESAEQRAELNPKLWNDGGKLKSEVAEKIEELVDCFVDTLKKDGVAIDVADIELVGSNCSYNYTKNSDLDVHVIASTDGLDDGDGAYEKLYSAYKSIWGRKHSISFYGVPVELYVETDKSRARDGIHSNGIYSVKSGEWLKQPTEESAPEIDKKAYGSRLAEVKADVKKALGSGDEDEVKLAIDRLYDMRTKDLDANGEYGIDNLVFKAIRNAGLLDKLKKERYALEDDRLSLRERMLASVKRVLSESLSQDIADSYRKLSKAYGVNLTELVYGADGFMNARYPNGFQDFRGDLIYSEKHWAEFEEWLRDEKGITLRSACDESLHDDQCESL